MTPNHQVGDRVWCVRNVDGQQSGIFGRKGDQGTVVAVHRAGRPLVENVVVQWDRVTWPRHPRYNPYVQLCYLARRACPRKESQP
jgi:hypothetical protein